jgi:hypothetical protein
MWGNSSKTVFSRNVSGVGGGITTYSASLSLSSASSTVSSSSSASMSMYTALSAYVESIRIIFEEYKLGRFNAVATILTQNVYNTYAVRLSNLSADPNKYREYETLRISCVNALHGMYQGVQQYERILDLQNELELSKENEAILFDPVRLNAYIADLNRPKFAFPDSNVTTIAATLKPEYAEYIRLYGYPEGGVFDMDKLAAILKQLMFNL